jgi:hypothetical protein
VTASQHPVDRLIRELIASGRAATEAEIAAIVARMAGVPFDPRMVPVAAELRGLTYLGQALGTRDTALNTHLVKRVVAEKQWAYGTTAAQYLADIRRAVRSSGVRLALYERRGGPIAAALTSTDLVLSPAECGTGALPLFLVVYSADRGIIISGYQVSSMLQIGIPQEARWLSE